MASQTEPITTTDVPNYVGLLAAVGAKFGKSPIVSRAIQRNGVRPVTGSQYPMINTLTGDAPAQVGVTEDASLSPGTNTSFAAAQVTNYMQMWHKKYAWSYASQSLYGNVSGVPGVPEPIARVANISTQRQAHLMWLAQDVEYSCLRGTAQAWTNAATAGTTGGVVTAIEAGSETAAAGASLSKALLETEIKRMAAAGAVFEDPVLACGAHQYWRLSELFAFAPQSRTEGGYDIVSILLPIAGRCDVVYNPILADDDVALLDMAHLKICFGYVPGKPQSSSTFGVLIEPLAKTGAGDFEQMWALFGVDYENILFHGMVSGLATS
jgi:hypothetical protein